MDATEHHSTEHDLIQQRLAKVERIRGRGDEPFKYAFERSCSIAEARERFEQAEAEAGESHGGQWTNVALAGRMTSFRGHGKSAFADVRDESGRVQIYFKRNDIGEEAYATLDDLDLGDFLGVHGYMFRTRTNEITVHVERYEILTKALRPLPEKYHGLTDVETRYRQRYLDLVANPGVMDTFRARIVMVDSLRRWLQSEGFLEVETPMLHPIPGGAMARPFVTYHNTYERQLYLRIAPELYLKRLIVGGFEKVFEINRSFRNEGVDTRHNPEFTMLELYEAYQDYKGLMDRTEALFSAAIEAAVGGSEFEYQGTTIDAAGPWKRMKLFDAIQAQTGVDLSATRDRDEAAELARKAGVSVDETMGYGKIVDEVMSERVTPNLVNPTFLYDYPIELSPLAKKKRGNPALTERYQVFMGGLEVCNAFSELNDPVDQRERFEDQVRQRERGDDEAQRVDDDFLKALEVGMPPTAGLGIGIDRLAMLLTDSASIREVILFPQLRTL